MGGAPLNVPVTAETVTEALARFGPSADAIGMLLSAKNGFFAFGSSLHVYPLTDGPDSVGLVTWNEGGLWKRAFGEPLDDVLFFAEDIFGGQFCLVAGVVQVFDPEAGELEGMADGVEQWAEQLLEEPDVLTGYPLAEAWEERHGRIAPGHRLVPKVPFVLGGDFELENLSAMQAVESMRYRADIARKLRDSWDASSPGW